jgi:hypothetical protein
MLRIINVCRNSVITLKYVIGDTNCLCIGLHQLFIIITSNVEPKNNDRSNMKQDIARNARRKGTTRKTET